MIKHPAFRVEPWALHETEPCLDILAQTESLLGVTPEEMAAWRTAADRILIPYDRDLGVHPQAEAFTTHEAWSFAATKPDPYPLLLHFPYFDLYRKQIVKQPDLVLAMHLCGDSFTLDDKTRNFDYYERITVRDSSLSACTEAVLAAEVGCLPLALDDVAEAALMDLRTASTTRALELVHHGERFTLTGAASVELPDRASSAAPRGGLLQGRAIAEKR